MLSFSWGKNKAAAVPRKVLPATTPTTNPRTLNILTIKDIKSLNEEFKKVQPFLKSTEI